MPDQERRVEKVIIGADFTLLRYCEYLPWLAGAGEGEVSPLVSELWPDRSSDPSHSRPGARLTGNNFNNMSPIVTLVTRTLATLQTSLGWPPVPLRQH